MAKVINTRNQSVVVKDLEVASAFFSRLQGLIGRKTLSEGAGLLIRRSGNSIHTFFMQFPIDVAFVNKKGIVKFIAENVKPWRLIFAPLLLSTDCLELPAGTLKKTGTQKGDCLRVEA